MSDLIVKAILDTRNGRNLSISDAVSIDDFTVADVELVMELARKFREAKTEKLDLMKGRSVALAFFESSTRTQSSFDWATKHLGGDTVGVGKGTAEKKGESYFDIAQVIDAMNIACFVIRTEHSGLPAQLARHIGASVVNAGDGWHEHPTQALLDLLTIVDETGTLEGKTITIIGDITHSRVFGSTARIFKKFGATLRAASPATLQPEYVEEVFDIKTFYNVEEALTGADIVYVMRVQNERGATGDIPTLREYSKAYGISEARLKLAKPEALLMHPGPVQRDIDIHSGLMAIPNSRILRQAENGLAIRKALLWLLATGPKKSFSRI